MGTKKHLAKMKASLTSSKKRKLDEAELESSTEPEFSSKDKEIKSLRAIIRENEAKIADLQKQLDWAMNLNSLQEKIAASEERMAKMQDEFVANSQRMAKMQDEITEMKSAPVPAPASTPTPAADTITTPDEEQTKLSELLKTNPVFNAKFQVLDDGIQDCNGRLDKHVQDCKGRLDCHSDNLNSLGELVDVLRYERVPDLEKQVEKLKKDQLDKVLGKTIKEFME